MHMADALISPAVGGVMWVATGGLIAISARRLKAQLDQRKVPLMGVLGAFIFSAQMINFSIPGTGSSGHIGGAMILSILLGPHAAFLTIASVVAVQALFFADGGLLALGCNIFNLGFFPCFIAYPWVYKKIVGPRPSDAGLMLASVAAVVVGLQMGAWGVVLETVSSGISELPMGSFAALMLPIHLVIGLIEGLITAAVVELVWKAQPEIIELAEVHGSAVTFPVRRVLAGMGVAAILMAGLLSWFASSDPDGLEWSMARVSGQEELDAPHDGVHGALAGFQDTTSFMPDYDLKQADEARPAPQPQAEPVGTEHAAPAPLPWGTSLAGLVGALLTLCLVGLLGAGLKKSRAQAADSL